jgi:RNA polymerase sigma factor (sigma-70 family)
MPQEPTDSVFKTSYTLLDRIKNPSDEQAWKEFVSIYDQYIYNILRHIRIPEADARELCQDIIVKLWKKIPEFAYNKDRGKFRNWLGSIIRNDANTYFSKNKKKNELIDEHGDSEIHQHANPNSTYDLDKVITEEWNYHLSNLAWESVKPHFKENTLEIFKLYMEGKSNKEISEACNIKERSVKTYILRIRNHLKEEISKINEELL